MVPAPPGRPSKVTKSAPLKFIRGVELPTGIPEVTLAVTPVCGLNVTLNGPPLPYVKAFNDMGNVSPDVPV